MPGNFVIFFFQEDDLRPLYLFCEIELNALST